MNNQPHSKTQKLTVKLPSGSAVTYEMEPGTTVGALKKWLREMKKVGVSDEFELYKDGNKMEYNEIVYENLKIVEEIDNSIDNNTINSNTITIIINNTDTVGSIINNNSNKKNDNVSLRNLCMFINCKLKAKIIIGNCRFCKKKFCGKHRIQEAHTCGNIGDSKIEEKRNHCEYLEAMAIKKKKF